MDLVQIVAEPHRRKILWHLSERELSVGDIAAEVELSVAATSVHLARLREAGIVSVRVDGKRRLYRADRESLGGLAPLLHTMWTFDLDSLTDAAEREHRQSRKK